MAITYKDSGVDLELYEQAMQRLPRLMHRTFTPRVVRNDGGFAGLYALDFAKSIFSRKAVIRTFKNRGFSGYGS